MKISWMTGQDERQHAVEFGGYPQPAPGFDVVTPPRCGAKIAANLGDRQPEGADVLVAEPRTTDRACPKCAKRVDGDLVQLDGTFYEPTYVLRALGYRLRAKRNEAAKTTGQGWGQIDERSFVDLPSAQSPGAGTEAVVVYLADDFPSNVGFVDISRPKVGTSST